MAYLFVEFHNPRAVSTAQDFKAFEPSSLSQGLKLLLSSFFPSWVVSQHNHVHMEDAMSRKIILWSYR